LRDFAQFWADDVVPGRVACCALVDPQIVAEEPEQFDCSTCEVSARLDGLDDENVAAWTLYRQCCNRFVHELGAGAVVLERLTTAQDAEQFGETCERLRVLHDVLQPPKRTDD
jgi:hypothetical protein